MKKTIWLAAFLFYAAGCGQQTGHVNKQYEDGIEVVVSGTKPYRLAKARIPSHLEEELVIDLEDKRFAEIGLYQLDTFTVDLNGNIYVLSLQSEGVHIFKFKPNGEFERSFGQHGQGPGELARPIAVLLTDKKELMVTDPDNTKLVYFSQEGSLIREVHLNRNIPFVYPLEPDRFLVFGRMQPARDQKYLKYPLELCGGNFEPLLLLDEYSMENFRITRRFRGTQPGFGLAVSGEHIFIGNEEREYDIWVFDFEGTLVRKIRKSHIPVPVSEDIKEKALAAYTAQMRQMVFFPKFLPPFKTMTADEDGVLYVVTFEEGDAAGENRIDVFNPDGAFVGQLSAAVVSSTNTVVKTVARKGRFYYIREKDSGFYELVAGKIVVKGSSGNDPQRLSDLPSAAGEVRTFDGSAFGGDGFFTQGDDGA